MRTCVLGTLLALALALLAGPVEAADPEPYGLENGLRVLLRPIRGAADVAVVVLFDVGNAHDPDGQSGLAHMAEHLYTVGAAGRFPARTVQELMRSYPKGWNAQTGERFMVIAHVTAKAKLADELEHAAARMEKAVITQAELDREKQRLKDEVHNMFGGGLALAAFNRARECVRPSPVGARRGGVPAQVDALTLEQVRGFYRDYLKPRNAWLCVAGDFDAAVVKEQVERLFAKIPAGKAAPKPRRGAERRVGGVVKLEVTPRMPGPEGMAVLSYSMPDRADYGAFLVAVVRILRELMPSGMGVQSFPPPVYYAVLDDPWVLTVSRAVNDVAEGEKALAEMEQAVIEALEGPPTAVDLGLIRMRLGYLLGMGSIPDAMLARNVYGAAFGLGRRHQLGLDPDELMSALPSEEAFDALRKTVFSKDERAALVVTAAP